MTEHLDATKGDQVEELIAFMTPPLTAILRRLEGGEFTTGDFIAVLQTDPAGKAAYEEALQRWGESERYAKMVIHGQVIPGVLRRSALVEWAGYAHDEDDAYAVPAWWRLRPAG